MIKFYKSKKFKSLFFSIGMVLISSICILSLLDASEYVLCLEIGICEFLELDADLSASQKIKDVMESKIIFNKNIPSLNGFLKFFFISSKLHHIGYSFTSIQDLELSFPLFILYRSINSRIDQEILHALPGESGEVLVNHKYNSPSIVNCLPSPTLKLIATSIINS